MSSSERRLVEVPKSGPALVCCQHARFGCKARGRIPDILFHYDSCDYEKVSKILLEQEQEIDRLKKMVADPKEPITVSSKRPFAQPTDKNSRMRVKIRLDK
jgi:hypothetical protein